uniref:Uncharacterized protein n=1 Tax=Siphoviridae sp. ct3R43 TaxID=2825321 RepID=A0A8S5VFX2_9CAUD|nr:MAG TPA: hypothetical protein [Siphoviridae sp. ct3R43]
MTKAPATIRRSATIERLSSDYREKLSATIANRENKNPVFETRRKDFQNRIGNFSEIGGKLSGK